MPTALALTLLLASPPSTAAAVSAALEQTPAGGARAVAATRPLLGMPYLRDALGEGSGPDADPRFRLDAFDCMTFVETAVALGSSRSLDEAARALDDVRYDGAPRLDERHHEVLAQWIPANEERGYLTALTRAIAGDRARWEEHVFTAEGWAALHRAGRAVRGLPPAREPLGRVGTWVVPPSEVAAVAAQLPEGALVFVVRADDPLRPSRVAHAGLVVTAPDGTRWIRHATSSVTLRRVIEEPIARFLRREGAAHPGWPLAGLAFFAVQDATARVQGLGQAAALIHGR